MTLFLDTPTVILNSCEAIYEAFVKKADHLSERPPTLNFSPMFRLTGGMKIVHCVMMFVHCAITKFLVDAMFLGLGIMNERPGKWQKLRRQLLMVFKEHGVG